jgi:hypothetical protein
MAPAIASDAAGMLRVHPLHSTAVVRFGNADGMRGAYRGEHTAGSCGKGNKKRIRLWSSWNRVQLWITVTRCPVESSSIQNSTGRFFQASLCTAEPWKDGGWQHCEPPKRAGITTWSGREKSTKRLRTGGHFASLGLLEESSASAVWDATEGNDAKPNHHYCKLCSRLRASISSGVVKRVHPQSQRRQ